MAKGDIPLSPRYGVNPMLTVCFYCGEDTGEIALLGKLPGDTEAPRKGIVDKRPCAKCAEHMRAGIMLIQVRDGSTGDTPYRTGPIAVVTEEAIKRIITTPSLVTDILHHRVCFIEKCTWDALGLPE